MSVTKPLIIVESPAKTKTLKNFLGGEYEIRASMGHVRDLPKSKLGVDIEADFQPSYAVIPERKKTIEELKKAVASAKEVFIASDPDREGEAIAWHLAEALKLRDAHRIEFNEITKQAVTEAFSHSRKIDDRRVGAQQARRVLDRLVGYKISPLLWSKVKRNLSAGRVQSVAVRLICDRERAIQSFIPTEYWTITAQLTPRDKHFPFEARLAQIDDKKAEISNETEATGILKELDGAEYRVAKVAKAVRRRNAPAPFITSTLQQEASRKLGFTAARTMRIAQDLYEGVELGSEGAVGLITYLRTDSTRVSEEAIAEAREYVKKAYGPEYLPAEPKTHRRAKTAQDAHEAIRPTSVLREPDKLKSFLNTDQMKLYRLIWLRFVASQMNPAVYDVETVDISAGRFMFRAAGSTEKFKGFRVVYTESTDEISKEMADEDRPPLPSMSKDDLLSLLGLAPAQHFTEPPPRYTEASLVKALEDNGIGRPSTYAAIISTIRDRGYVDLLEKRFVPTDLGFIVTDLLVKHFPKVLDVAFTAGVETQLDEVAKGTINWVTVLKDFYGPFELALTEAQEKMERVKVQPKESDQVCPNCGKVMLIREGRFGQFLGCSGFPECRTILKVDKNVGVTCPECREGQVVEKISKKRKAFFGCSRYPECKFVSWDKPVEERCPQCGGMMVEKTYKTRGSQLRCTAERCGYSRTVAVSPAEPDGAEENAKEAAALAS